MKMEPRTIAIIAVVIAVLGAIAFANRGDDNILPSPSGETGGPGAAAVEDVESATPSVTPEPSDSPTDDADSSDSENEGDESEFNSDDASDDFSDDESDDTSDDESDEED